MGRRVLAVALAILVLGGAAAALLSDRAPGALDAVTDRAAAEVQAVERTTGRDLVSRDDVPIDAQTLGHGVLFAALTVTVALAAGRRASLLLVGAGVFAVSVGFEVLQAQLTTTRLAEPGDLVANAVGVGVGLATVAVGRAATARSSARR